MNTNDLNTALYEKMAAEQDKFRDWLKSQPPEEVLNHAYEYTIREDIVMAMEELELTDTQAQALLESPSPLADVYRYFEKLETGYMDVIRDSIESRADDVCRAKEETVSGALEGGTEMKILKCLLMIVTAPVILVLPLFVCLLGKVQSLKVAIQDGVYG